MSETDTTVPAPPEAPAAPTAPAPPVETPEAPTATAAPESNPVTIPATDSIKAIVASHAGDATTTDPEPAEDTPTAPEDTEEETPAVATVTNTATNQYVTQPDGTQVFTRSHGYPISNAEWQQFELTHAGDQARYPYVPGDQEYNPNSDPHVPNSHMAQMIEAEIASFAERVLKDPDAIVSNIWNTVKGMYEAEVKNFTVTGEGEGKVVE